MAVRLISSGLRSSGTAMSICRQLSTSHVSCGDEPGRGAGKGGGSGGSIRDAGGSFGKREAAQEDQYFRKLQQEQLAKIKNHLKDEINHHEEELKHHREAIERHKEKLEELQRKEKD